ncbi:MAG: RagB/SusD family nutrient uptake outer membrane protein [Flavitalea sp.]
MKNNIVLKIMTVLLLGSSFSSCKKFLEENPKSNVTVANYYQTEGDAISAVNSIYAYLNSTSSGSTAGVYHSTFWVTAGLASDEMLNNQIGAPQYDQLATFSHSAQNGALEEIWAMHYKTITIANIAISRIPGISMNAALKARLIGEAKFLRGLMYFNLVRMFGDVPLIIEENAPVIPEVSTVDAIYAQVVSDLGAAAADLPASYAAGNGRGRATNGAANAILAKVYLTMEDWPNAAATAKKVIDSNQYQLWEDFADVFKLSSRSGKEAIFSVGFGDADGAIIFWEVGQFLVRLLPTQLSEEGVINAQGWQIPTQDLYNAYEADDRRREVTFITEINGASTTTIRPYIQKYWDRIAEPKGNESSNDFPVIRYSDVLLIYAEANNELGNADLAHQYINMVRKRARFNGTTYENAVPDYSGLSQDQMRTAILEERRIEFVAEGQRWFDLARMGKLETEVPAAKPGVTPTTKHYLFPIPQREIDLNPNLEQNAGY